MNEPNRKIYFLSSNRSKLNLLKQIMLSTQHQIKIIPISVDIDEIQSTDNEIVAEDKINSAYDYIKNKYEIDNFELICEDTGYSFANMNGFPGALIRFYHDSIGNEGICKFHAGSRAINTSVVAYSNGSYIELFTNQVSGTVTEKPRLVLKSNNSASCGLDNIFIPDYPKKLEQWNGYAYSEIPTDIKNIVSARAQSFNDLKNYLLDKTNNNYDDISSYSDNSFLENDSDNDSNLSVNVVIDNISYFPVENPDGKVY